MHNIRQQLGCLIIAVAALLATPAAFAAELADLKARGVVGERADGYLGTVPAAVPVDAAALVESVNSKRKEHYLRIAAQNNLSLTDVEALAGRKTLEKTAPGDWIFIDSWRKK